MEKAEKKPPPKKAEQGPEEYKELWTQHVRTLIAFEMQYIKGKQPK